MTHMGLRAETEMAKLAISLAISHPERGRGYQGGTIVANGTPKLLHSGESPPVQAGELGFEPRLTDPESVVLPLHHSPFPSPNPMRHRGQTQEEGEVNPGPVAGLLDGLLPGHCGRRGTRLGPGKP